MFLHTLLLCILPLPLYNISLSLCPQEVKSPPKTVNYYCICHFSVNCLSFLTNDNVSLLPTGKVGSVSSGPVRLLVHVFNCRFDGKMVLTCMYHRLLNWYSEV